MLTHPFDSGNSDCQTVLDQLYHAYAEPMSTIPKRLVMDSRSWRSICVYCHWIITTQFSICVVALCSAYERKAFLDGLQYGAELMLELGKESDR